MGFLDKKRNRSSGDGAKPGNQDDSDLKGRRGVTKAREELRLELLSERRQKCRIKLLLNIIGKEDAHPVLCAAYDEVIKQTEGAIHTRSQSRNEPIKTKKSL